MEEQENFLINLRRRDSRSFDALYKRYGTPLFNLAYKLTGNSVESEEIVQETFIKIFESIDGFNGESKLFTWIYSICLNVCRYRLQLKKRMKFENIEGLIIESSGWDYRKDSRSEEEWDYYTSKVREGCLLSLVRCLPFSQRAAFILHIILKLPVSSVAAILGKTNGSTRVLICRGKLKVKTFLCKNCSHYNENNRCRCANFVDYSLRHGLIDIFPQQNKLKDTLSLIDLIQKDIDDLRKLTAFYGNLQDKFPTPKVSAEIRKVIKSMSSHS